MYIYVSRVRCYLLGWRDEPSLMMTLSIYWMMEVATVSAIDSLLSALPLHAPGRVGWTTARMRAERGELTIHERAG